MNKERGQVLPLLAIIIAIVACGVVAGVLGWTSRQMSTTVTVNESVGMVQPQGVNPDKDLQNSETNLNNSGANLNNSEANLNNAQALAIPTLTAAEYELKMAQACAIRGDCAVGTYLQGQAVGKGDTMRTFGLSTVGLVIAGIVIFLVLVIKR